jgi:dTMP kinase
VLVAIEGIDGSGKQTQTELLVERARGAGLRVASLSFPRYEQTVAAEGIAAYLRGDLGDLGSVDPQLAGLLFATDRFESLATLEALRAEHDLVVLDRYTASNIAHQASRAPQARRSDVARWLERIERDVFGLPAPDLTVLLDLDPDHAQAAARERGQAIDIPEADGDYLRACRSVYLEQAGDPRWRTVASDREDGSRLPAGEVASAVWAAVEAELHG